MKKLLRSISLILVFLMICFTFCGCTALDEMRKTHAVWGNEEKTVIELNGKEYKLLSDCDSLSPDGDTSISVTESDVPLLLADMFGDYAWISDDEDFIVVDPYDGYTQYVDKESETRNYCVSNRYDEVEEQIKNGVNLNSVCYEYYTYDFEADDYITKYYKLTEEQIFAISDAIQYGETALFINEDDIVYDIMLYVCSDDMLFKEYAAYLTFTDTNIYIDYNNYSEDETEGSIYVVPDEFHSIFFEIANEYIEAEGTY